MKMYIHMCIFHRCNIIYFAICCYIWIVSCTRSINLDKGIIRVEHGITFGDTGNLNTIVGVSAKQCIDACVSRPRCNAATVHRKLQICRLSSSVVQDENLLKDGGSVAFLGFNDLKNRASCGENTCSQKEACKYIGGNFVCQTMECGRPNFIPSSFETAGNVYSIGARLLVSNPYYRSYIECNPSGEWCVNDVTWRECPNTDCIARYDYQYRYIRISTTMEDAELFCRLSNSHLIEVKSHHDTTEVLQYLLKGGQWSWIGLVDKDKNGNWMWLSGSAVIYTNWKDGEPNYIGTEQCVVGGGPPFSWNNVRCNKHYQFICQRQFQNVDDPDTLIQCQ